MEIKISVNGSSSLDKKKFILIGLNLLLFISFFLPWIKTTSELAMGLDYFSMGSVDGYLRLSPYRVISVVNKLSSYLGSATSEYQKIYVFLIIPIGAIINIITYFIKKERSKIVQLITSSLALILVLYVFSQVSSIDDIGYFIKANVGFYLALISSLAIIGMQFIKFNASDEDKNLAEASSHNDEKKEAISTENLILEDVGDAAEESNKDESAFKKNTDQLVNYLKDDFSSKDKLHKSLIVYGLIVIIAMILGIVFELDYNNSVLPAIISSVITLLVFAYIYFKVDFKLSLEKNEQLVALSDSFNGVTDKMKSLDKRIMIIAFSLIIIKFLVAYLFKSYEMIETMYVANLLLNTVIVIVFIRIFAIKDFKGLRNAIIALGIMYLLLIFRRSSYSYYWIDYKSMYMLGISWVGFLLVETNYK